MKLLTINVSNLMDMIPFYDDLCNLNAFENLVLAVCNQSRDFSPGTLAASGLTPTFGPHGHFQTGDESTNQDTDVDKVRRVLWNNGGNTMIEKDFHLILNDDGDRVIATLTHPKARFGHASGLNVNPAFWDITNFATMFEEVCDFLHENKCSVGSVAVASSKDPNCFAGTMFEVVPETTYHVVAVPSFMYLKTRDEVSPLVVGCSKVFEPNTIPPQHSVDYANSVATMLIEKGLLQDAETLPQDSSPVYEIHGKHDGKKVKVFIPDRFCDNITSVTNPTLRPLGLIASLDTPVDAIDASRIMWWFVTSFQPSDCTIPQFVSHNGILYEATIESVNAFTKAVFIREVGPAESVENAPE